MISNYLILLKRGTRIALRNKVNDSLITGIRLVDSCLPIGRGQRQLILGDKSTGKTSIFVFSLLTSWRYSIISSFEGFSTKRLFGLYLGININLSKLMKLLHSILYSNFSTSAFSSSPFLLSSSFSASSALTSASSASSSSNLGSTLGASFANFSSFSSASFPACSPARLTLVSRLGDDSIIFNFTLYSFFLCSDLIALKAFDLIDPHYSGYSSFYSGNLDSSLDSSFANSNSTQVSTVDSSLQNYSSVLFLVISTHSSSSALLSFMIVNLGMTICERLRDRSFDSLICFDDLSKHAKCYRQVSLLLGRVPSRDAYSADVFNIHSSLLERSGRLRLNYFGSSITAFPIIETINSDITEYIATNVISITDGQLYMNKRLFLDSIRPAIDSALSVSRIGSNAQCKFVKVVSAGLKNELTSLRIAFNSFGSQSSNSFLKLSSLNSLFSQSHLIPSFIE